MTTTSPARPAPTGQKLTPPNRRKRRRRNGRWNRFTRMLRKWFRRNANILSVEFVVLLMGGVIAYVVEKLA